MFSEPLEQQDGGGSKRGLQDSKEESADAAEARLSRCPATGRPLKVGELPRGSQSYLAQARGSLDSLVSFASLVVGKASTQGTKVSFKCIGPAHSTAAQHGDDDGEDTEELGPKVQFEGLGPRSNISIIRGATKTLHRNATTTLQEKMNARTVGTVRYGTHFTAKLGTELTSQITEEFGVGDGDEIGKALEGSFLRRFVAFVLFSQGFEMFAGMVILANFITIALETDARVIRGNQPPDSTVYAEAGETLETIWKFNVAFLAFYVAECASRFFVLRWKFFKNKWDNLDLLIVLSGILGMFLEALLEETGPSTGPLRAIRNVRLLRASRLLISFQELHYLVCGLTYCMRTLLWAGGLIFMMLTMWSILAVENLHPLMVDLDAEGYYDTCSWCGHAFENILMANLTFFQIMSGDGWSTLCRPMIEKHPWTAVIIVAVIFTMLFGLLNLVTAVIVDTAARAREEDIMKVAEQKESDRRRAWACFSVLCKKLDVDDNGDIDVEELKKGIHEIPELAAYISCMGIEEEDIGTLMEMLDQDGNGCISHMEFASRLYKMKTQEERTGICVIKHLSENIMHQMSELTRAARPEDTIIASAKALEDGIREMRKLLQGITGGFQYSALPKATHHHVHKTLPDQVDEPQRAPASMEHKVADVLPPSEPPPCELRPLSPKQPHFSESPCFLELKKGAMRSSLKTSAPDIASSTITTPHISDLGTSVSSTARAAAGGNGIDGDNDRGSVLVLGPSPEAWECGSERSCNSTRNESKQRKGCIKQSRAPPSLEEPLPGSVPPSRGSLCSAVSSRSNSPVKKGCLRSRTSVPSVS